jgi:hypothetical protein
MNSYQNFPFTSRIFKLVGVILILSFAVDFLMLLFFSGPRNSQWQIGLATAAVDRGLVPMIGLALIFTGYWIDYNTSNNIANRKSWLDLRLWAVLSSLLGLFFLLLIPIHANNVTQARAQTIQGINQEAKQAESNLQTQLGQLQAQLGDQRVKAELEKFKSQVQELLKNEQRFNQALQSNQYSENEKKLLQQFKANPQALDAYLAQQSDPSTLGNQKLNQIRAQRQELEQQARQDTWRSGLRVGINSLLFAIGYAAIGWTGLRNTRIPSARR